MKIIDYFVCGSESLKKLEQKVMINIEDGWNLQGGISCMKDEKSETGKGYFQAMVKYEESEESIDKPKIFKIECKACKGNGEWFIGDGSGRTSRCIQCNGKGHTSIEELK